jgi:hypothetical protein
MRMKGAIAIVVLAACGHAAPAPARALANHAPPDAVGAAPIDAEGVSDTGMDCHSSEPQPMHVGGADAAAHLDVCDDTTINHWRVDLVVASDDARETLDVAEWDGGGEEAGMAVEIAGVLAAPGGDDAVLVVSTRSRPVGAELVAYTVRNGALTKVYSADAGVMKASLSTDDSVATIEMRSADDAKAFELRWDGQTMHDTTVTP